jgi:hypothetical protein
MTDPAVVFRKCPDARYRNIGGEGIVVRQAAGEVLVLNGVGARVLDLLEPGSTLESLLDALGAEYDIDPDVLRQDVHAYLQELRDAGVIETAAGGAHAQRSA